MHYLTKELETFSDDARRVHILGDNSDVCCDVLKHVLKLVLVIEIKEFFNDVVTVFV